MEVEEYVHRLIAGDDEACLEEGRRMARDVDGLRGLYVDVIQRSQYLIGDLWERGELSVAAEHLATATNSFVAAACYAPLAARSAGGPKAVVTCAPGELHELGPRLLSDILECDGWDVDFYGASLPADELIAVIRERRPRFVGISAALERSLDEVARTIAAVRDALGEEAPPIMVGGNAFRGDPGQWRRVGADLFAADATSAVEELRVLKT